MDNNQNIKNVAESFWKYFEPKLEEKTASTLTYFRATVVANPGDGTLTVQKPYDETALNLPCVSSMADAAVDSQVTVLVFGKNIANNAVVVADGKVSTLGGGKLPIASETTLGGIKIGNGVAIDATSGVMDTNVWVNDEEPTGARVGDIWVDTTKKGFSFDEIYPVGSIYMSVTSTNPATLFGVGTWEQIKGRFLLGVGSPEANTDNYFGTMSGAQWNAGVKSKGGQDYHTLTTNEIPSHLHSVGGAYTALTGGSVPLAEVYRSTQGANVYYNTDAAGGGASHNNMPPYFAVYIWYRTA